jgi:hypothetical protein
MSDFTPASLTEMVASDVREEVASVSRSLAALMADPQTRAPEHRPAFMGRRMGVVTAVSDFPLFPLVADVELNDTVIPGCSPQSTYRPIVGDLVWLEFLGPDPHISPPLATEANRKWNDFTLGSGWSTYGSGTSFPSYWRDAQGVVHLEGAMAGGAAGSVFATLPVGFRPRNDKAFPATYSNGTSYVAGMIAVRSSTGNLEWHGGAAPVTAFLDGITFRID